MSRDTSTAGLSMPPPLFSWTYGDGRPQEIALTLAASPHHALGCIRATLASTRLGAAGKVKEVSRFLVLLDAALEAEDALRAPTQLEI